MSNNKRLARALIAGVFFAGLGVLGTLTGETPYGGTSPAVRKPAASATCVACRELVRLQTELFSRPSPDLIRSRAKKAQTEAREAWVLKSAAAVILDFSRDRDPSPEELQAATIFLTETRVRDGASIVLNFLADGLSVERMDKFLLALEAEIAELVADNVIELKSAEAYRATIAAFRAQGSE